MKQLCLTECWADSYPCVESQIMIFIAEKDKKVNFLIDIDLFELNQDGYKKHMSSHLQMVSIRKSERSETGVLLLYIYYYIVCFSIYWE